MALHSFQIGQWIVKWQFTGLSVSDENLIYVIIIIVINSIIIIMISIIIIIIIMIPPIKYIYMDYLPLEYPFMWTK